ncbi:pullulanase-type alpha-1,6-glucosidase [Luteococcus sp.]|uniref:pullulanase-type alpha-1,6-glucosidase n=1 Tax=Luteococcus sp. TaxID=1969402 RepID=UPI00373627E9
MQNPSITLIPREGLAHRGCQAVWLDRATIAVPRHLDAGLRHPPRRQRWVLLWSPLASVDWSGQTVTGLEADDVRLVELEAQPAGLPDQLRARHRAQAVHLALRLPRAAEPLVPEMLTGQLLLGRVLDGRLDVLTGLQLGPVLDDVHAPSARQRELGPHVHGERIHLGLWAPTAQQVHLLLWPADAGSAPPLATARRRAMTRTTDGTWTASLGRDCLGARYLYEVRVHSPATGRIQTNLVTDPWSTGLTVDSQRSVLVDLSDPAALPGGWERSFGPRLRSEVDVAVYELHVRDFSTADGLVPAALRGSYLAFAHDGHGTRHLEALARAGINTVHLLPCFDVASIPEATPMPQPNDAELARLRPDDHRQQQMLAALGDADAFNWGYDPWHWGVPEGSYASTVESADGARRVGEFRVMVHALHQMGLRVVMDQVFTHTAASGQDQRSVLDRITPGYHHRLDAMGLPEGSTTANNVATERLMTEKLMVEMVVRWARDYHVDGFRFDLMGHSSARNMARVRHALDQLTVERDGINGREVHLYGEGWNFGEVADNALFTQATQGQLDGTRIATFNDRIRDAVRGGRPFDEDPRRQGFATGLAGDPNGSRWDVTAAEELGRSTDLLMLGMAGNLRDYSLRCHDGWRRRGDQIDYGGRPAGYAAEPFDVVNYVDAHDNETLWDALTLKLPAKLPMDQRIRMNTLALATVVLGQSPFLWHAGADLLRSKSFDRNSYNSGDWFNRLDWTGAHNGFGRGLPPAPDNMTRWPWLRPLLADPTLKPTPEQVREANHRAHDLLHVRSSTPLLRLGRAELVHQMVHFPVAGTELATPGAVVMHVDNRERLVPGVLDGAVVVLNACPGTVRQPVPSLAGLDLRLCPAQADGRDPVTASARFIDGVLEVPGRTAAVFWQRA